VEDLGGAIRGAIVDDKNLEVREGLASQRLQRMPHHFLAVSDGKED
jgi:hypothetical protein